MADFIFPILFHPQGHSKNIPAGLWLGTNDLILGDKMLADGIGLTECKVVQIKFHSCLLERSEFLLPGVFLHLYSPQPGFEQSLRIHIPQIYINDTNTMTC